MANKTYIPYNCGQRFSLKLILLLVTFSSWNLKAQIEVFAQTDLDQNITTNNDSKLNAYSLNELKGFGLGGGIRFQKNYFIVESRLQNLMYQENSSGWSGLSVQGSGYCQVCWESRLNFEARSFAIEYGIDAGILFSLFKEKLILSLTGGAEFTAVYSNKILFGDYHYVNTSWGAYDEYRLSYGDDGFPEITFYDDIIISPVIQLNTGYNFRNKFNLTAFLNSHFEPYYLTAGFRIRYNVFRTGYEDEEPKSTSSEL